MPASTRSPRRAVAAAPLPPEPGPPTPPWTRPRRLRRSRRSRCTEARADRSPPPRRLRRSATRWRTPPEAAQRPQGDELAASRSRAAPPTDQVAATVDFATAGAPSPPQPGHCRPAMRSTPVTPTMVATRRTRWHRCCLATRCEPSARSRCRLSGAPRRRPCTAVRHRPDASLPQRGTLHPRHPLPGDCHRCQSRMANSRSCRRKTRVPTTSRPTDHSSTWSSRPRLGTPPPRISW
jgi:hypothetical protein